MKLIKAGVLGSAFLAGMLVRQVQVSHAWKVHQITGVSLYQILTGR